MNDGQTEFVIFAQVGAALGALCLLPVIINRIARRLRGIEPAHRPGATPAGSAEVLAAAPERIRARTLEHEAISSRVASRRAEALRELRALGSEETMTTMLVAVLDPNDDVRHEAAEGIVTLADPDAVEPLVHAVATRSRRSAAARDAILGLGSVAVPELQRLVLEATDPDMRDTAASLASELAVGREVVPA
jgi:HEAT repeat protein